MSAAAARTNRSGVRRRSSQASRAQSKRAAATAKTAVRKSAHRGARRWLAFLPWWNDAPRRRGARRSNAAPVSPSHPRAVILAGLAVAIAAVFHVWTGLRVSELGYQRSRAIELSQRLEAQGQQLAHELEGLSRTAFLEQEASRRLGLGLPSAGQVVDLRVERFASFAPEMR